MGFGCCCCCCFCLIDFSFMFVCFKEKIRMLLLLSTDWKDEASTEILPTQWLVGITAKTKQNRQLTNDFLGFRSTLKDYRPVNVSGASTNMGVSSMN